MPSMNSRGLSDIIYLAVILLLLISSASIIFAGVKRSALQLSPQFSCNEILISNPLRIDTACLNAASREIEVVLERPLGDLDIKSISFAVSGSGFEKWSCGNSCGSCTILEEGGKKVYILPGLNMQDPKKLVLYIEGCAAWEGELVECNP